MGATLSQQLKSRRGTSDSPSRRPVYRAKLETRYVTAKEQIKRKLVMKERQLRRKSQLEENGTLLIPYNGVGLKLLAG